MATDTKSPIEISKSEFKEIGYRLVDNLAEFMDSLHDRPITTGKTPGQIQKILGDASLPEHGAPASEIVAEASNLLLQHSLFNGHPKFYGYITASPAPIGM